MSFPRVEAQFSQLVASGEVLGRIIGDTERAGKTVLAPFGASGERATVELTDEKKGFARGQILDISQVSPDRIAPPCPFFRPSAPQNSCGGCAWQHLKIEAQRHAKREIVLQALARIGGQDLSSISVEATRGGESFGYRNKADFVIQNGKIGFFAGGSHDLVDVDNCLIQNAPNNAVLGAARAILAQFPIQNGPQRLISRVASDGRGLAILVGDLESARAQKWAQELQTRAPHLSGVIWKNARRNGNFQTFWGEPFLTETVNGLRFRVSGDGFWQINALMAPLMADLVGEMAGEVGGQRILDLFCGAGLFALHLARAGANVCGVELSAKAIEDARFNAQNNELNADFRVGDAAKSLKKWGKGAFDVVVLDPPRSGAREAMAAIERLAPPKIVWVSCDAATFARDVKSLSHYQLRRVVPLDLFPQTPHIETVALLTRKKGV